MPNTLRLTSRSARLWILLPLVLAACAGVPAHIGADAQWIGSPNNDERRPSLVVIHHTSDDRAEDALRTLTNPDKAVSAHYLLKRDGDLLQLVDERRRAWHAGISSWAGNNDVNSISVGIELDNNGEEPFADVQIDRLLSLLAELKQRYHLNAANFVGHADVAPRRKNDPSRYFPWQKLAQQGYGLWCDSQEWTKEAHVDALIGLQALGYDVSDPVSAIIAFKLHYRPGEKGNQMTASDRDMLACLLRKRAAAVAVNRS